MIERHDLGNKVNFHSCNLRIVMSKENTLCGLISNRMGAICPRIPGRKKGTAHVTEVARKIPSPSLLLQLPYITAYKSL